MNYYRLTWNISLNSLTLEIFWNIGRAKAVSRHFLLKSFLVCMGDLTHVNVCLSDTDFRYSILHSPRLHDALFLI